MVNTQIKGDIGYPPMLATFADCAKFDAGECTMLTTPLQFSSQLLQYSIPVVQRALPVPAIALLVSLVCLWSCGLIFFHSL